jgi:hypothetical protein
MTFSDELAAECSKIIRRHESYARELRDDDARRSRRTGIPHRGNVRRPSYWSVDKAFDPYVVRSGVEQVSRAIKLAMRNDDYEPYNPVAYGVPKPDGSTRTVSVFPLADATVSRRVYHSLLSKNKSRLSAYSYAYRDDLTAHDAIQNISGDLRGRGRVFLAEYDFAKYFDSISHQYVWRILTTKNFLMSPLERRVLEGFLATELQSQATYVRRGRTTDLPGFGLPQGTSVSLFLANVAAWELDRTMERLGLGFARYADDTLIWSHDYGRICEAVEALSTLSLDIGAEINFKKSHGISIFTPDGAPAEFAAKASVEFVGYRFGSRGPGMRNSVVERVKKRIAYLVWSNLLEPLERGYYVPSRISGLIDRDYLVLIMQLRRYLYGGLTEEKLSALRSGRARRISYPGLMSFFPLVDDVDQLKSLDGWMLHTVHTSLNRRAALLRANGAAHLPPPHGLARSALPSAKGHRTNGTVVDLKLPSFVRIGTLIRRAAQAHGANQVGRGGGPQHYQYT